MLLATRHGCRCREIIATDAIFSIHQKADTLTSRRVLRRLLVVAESYEELVFSEPSKQFYERVKGLEPEKAPRPELSVLGVVGPPNPQEELDRLNAARRQIAISTAKAQKQMAALLAA
jgi:hypothetical protein